MNLVRYRNLFFAFSLVIIIPGLVAIALWGLRLGIDFTGGTLWEVSFEKGLPQSSELQTLIADEQIQISSITPTSQNSMLMRMKVTDEEKITDLKGQFSSSFGKIEDVRLETVGPFVSRELATGAQAAIGISILAIVFYITWSFRKLPKPVSPLAFGICTIIALAHDVIVVAGIFAILGHFRQIEIDSLFITALLTVIGFSVHDTIVVFDRIRENLKKYSSFSFEEVVNHSLLQTMGRSLSTSLTAIFVLLALYLFGGESIKVFVLALLIGIISGTYSSIFNAAPFLVVWHNFRKKS